MKVTIKSIAKHFGTSSTTISRAINNSGYVKADLREAILKYAKEHDWHVSSAARSLRNGKTKTIAILVNVISFYHNQMIIEEILKTARKTGYHVFLSQCSTAEEQVTELKSYINRNPEFAIIIPIVSAKGEMEQTIKQLQSQGTKVVAIGKAFPEYCPAFEYNYKKHGYLAMKYLIANNHKKIMYLRQFEKQEDLAQTLINADKYMGGLALNGIDEAIKGSKNTFNRLEDVVSDNYRNYDHVVKIIKEKSHTAFICENENLLQDFYWLCRENNINIPNDISVIGLGYNPAFKSMNPAPAYTNDNLEKITKAITNIIISQESTSETRTLIDPNLVNGNSVKKLEILIK